MKGRKFFVSTLLVLSCFVTVFGIADTDPDGQNNWLERLKNFDIKKILKITALDIEEDLAGMSAFATVATIPSTVTGWTSFATVSDLTTDLAAGTTTWTGVTISGERVTQIDLSGQKIDGDLSSIASADLKKLSKVTVLNLSDNLIDSLPDFSEMPSLDTVRVGQNQLSGKIPDFFTKVNASSLDFTSNSYSEVPDAVITHWASSTLGLGRNAINLEGNNLDFEQLEKLDTLGGTKGSTDAAKLISNGIVKYSLPSGSSATDAITIDEGDELSYPIVEPSGRYNTYTWYLNGEEYVSRTDKADLYIKYAAETDGGSWVLKVTNSIVNPTSPIQFMSISITVNPCIVTGVDGSFTTVTGATTKEKYELTVCDNAELVLPTLYGTGGTVRGNDTTYTWQQANKDTTDWVLVGDTLNYQVKSITDTTLYRLIVYSDLCDPDTSKILRLNYISKIQNNTPFISSVTGTSLSETTICKSDNPPTIEGSLPTGGGGSDAYLYQWESMKKATYDSLKAGILAGATWTAQGQSQNYTPSSLQDSTVFRRTVTSKKGCELSDTSDVVQVYIFPDVQSNTISYNQEVCPGGTALTLKDTTFNLDSLSWDIDNFTFAWQKSFDKINWSEADTVYHTDSLPEFTPRDVQQLTYYRRVVVGQIDGVPFCSAEVDTSNIVTISMFPQIQNNIIDASQTKLCERYDESITYKDQNGADSVVTVTYNADTVMFSAAVPPTGGGGEYTYIWQTSLDSVNWSERSTIDTMYLNDTEFTDTLTYIRRIVNSKCYTDTSNVIEIEKTFNFGDNEIGTSQLLCIGTTPDTLRGNPQTTKGNFEFQWQVSTDSVNWQSAGADTLASQQDFGLDSLVAGYYYYRRAVFGGCRPNYSNVITIEVAAPISNNTVAGSQEICEGDTVALIIGGEVAGGGGGYYYEWESTTDTTARGISSDTTGIVEASVSWTRSDTSQHLQPDRITRTTFYRRITYANRCNPDTSNIVEVKVYNQIEDNTIRDNQRACAGDTLNILTGSTPTGGDPDAPDSTAWSYTWQFKLKDSDAGWTSISSDKDYQPEVLKESTSYRRIVTIATAGGRNCFADTSEVVTMTIIPKIQQNNITGDQVICEYYEGYQDYDEPDTLVGSKPVGGGNIEFQWQSTEEMSDYEEQRINDSTVVQVLRTDIWKDIPSARDTSYVPYPYPLKPTRYRRIVISESVNGQACFQDTSSAVIIDVIPLRFITIGERITSDSLITEGIEIEIGEDVELEAQGAGTYEWYEGNGRLDETTIIAGNEARKTVNPTISTVYTVVGVYSQGCRTEPTEVFVKVNQNPKFLKVSEVITPNDDGRNDNMYIKGLEKFPYNKVHIFNRWGVKLLEFVDYQNDSSENTWHGRLSGNAIEGEEVPAGVYFYMIEFYADDKHVKKATDRIKKGSITIIR